MQRYYTCTTVDLFGNIGNAIWKINENKGKWVKIYEEKRGEKWTEIQENCL